MVAWGRMGCPVYSGRRAHRVGATPILLSSPPIEGWCGGSIGGRKESSGPVLGRNGAVGGGLSRVSAGPAYAAGCPEIEFECLDFVPSGVAQGALVACKWSLLKFCMASIKRVCTVATLLVVAAFLPACETPRSLAETSQRPVSGWDETVDFDSYDVTVKADEGTVLFISCLTIGRTRGVVVVLDLPETSEAAEPGEVYPISFVVDGRTVPFAMTFDGEKLLFNASNAQEYFLWTLLIPEIAQATRLTVASPDLNFAHEIPTENAKTVQKEMFKACDVN